VANLGRTGVALGLFFLRATFLAGVFIFVATVSNCSLPEVALPAGRLEAFFLLGDWSDREETDVLRGDGLAFTALVDLRCLPGEAAVFGVSLADLDFSVFSSGRMSSGSARRSAWVSATLCSG